MHPSLGEDVYYLLEVDWSPLRSACGFRVTMDRIADLTLEAGRQHGNCEKSAPVESRHRRPVAGSFEPVVPTLCGSPEIVEGFLCRFRLGLGFPDLVVDGR